MPDDVAAGAVSNAYRHYADSKLMITQGPEGVSYGKRSYTWLSTVQRSKTLPAERVRKAVTAFDAIDLPLRQQRQRSCILRKQAPAAHFTPSSSQEARHPKQQTLGSLQVFASAKQLNLCTLLLPTSTASPPDTESYDAGWVVWLASPLEVFGVDIKANLNKRVGVQLPLFTPAMQHERCTVHKDSPA